MSKDRLLNQLNTAQRLAVATSFGPLLVLAGAGTGKTRVVTFRIAHLIRKGIQAERILAVTFTKKAAIEMQQRVRQLLGRRNVPVPEISTFHSLCVRILRRHAPAIGYPKKFAIYDSGDQESLASAALREINVPGALLKPRDLLFHVSRWKSMSVGPRQAVGMAETDKEHLAAMAYRRYQSALQAAGAMDFDDLLLCTEQLFHETPDALRAEATRFDHVMVDEYQDTNGSQYRIVKSLAGGHRNLCVVGDDDQSIYAWRGADVRHILRFKDDWPDAKVIALERNYRSTEQILLLANRLIRFNQVRHEKTLQPARMGGEKPCVVPYDNEELEAEQVVADICRRLNKEEYSPRDIAILFRTKEQPRAFETELRRRNVPYVLIGSMSFYDRKEVRDILAYLKVIHAPQDEVSLLRIINSPPRGISRPVTKTLLDHAVREGVPVWDVFSTVQKMTSISSTAQAAIKRFAQLIKDFQHEFEQNSKASALETLLEKISYRADLQRRYANEEEFQSRWSAIEEVINALASYEQRTAKPTLTGFLDDLLVEGGDDTDKEKQLDRDAVALMTLHSAKGLEFPFVYMVGMEEGLLPHHRSIKSEGDAIDEERRLCYVGITRAQERLTFSLSLSRMKWGKSRAMEPSRFLYEITGQADNPRDFATNSAITRHSKRHRRAPSRSRRSRR